MDAQLFFLINHLPHVWFSDTFFSFFSGIGRAGIIWFVFGLLLYVREEQKYIKFFLPFVTAGGLSYVIVGYLLKPLIGRVRPSIGMGAIIVGEMKTDFSLPSGHATIAYALAVVLSRYEPKYKKWFFLLASLISFSRIYLGVHYPLDVIAGGLLGWGIGKIAIYLHKAKDKGYNTPKGV